jgi:hypothetical protein
MQRGAREYEKREMCKDERESASEDKAHVMTKIDFNSCSTDKLEK